MFSFLKRWKRQRPKLHHQQTIHFMWEQDGPGERALKADLCPLFARSPRIERAYLVRANYGNPDLHEVVLCIQGAEDRRIVDAVGLEFRKRFNSEAHLDILFLEDSQEEELRRVAIPFYSATG